MKRIKKWLFPVLTCLIIAGAAVLPRQISQARDTRQFGRVHTETLAADSLPVYEPPGLPDRLALYARWYAHEPIPYFDSPEPDSAQAEEIVRGALLRLAEAEIIPHSIAEADSLRIESMYHVLLWDPTVGIGQQEPAAFWRITARLDEQSFGMDLDAESGLPLWLDLYDPNMAQWLSYKDPDTLPNLAQKYFDLLGLEAGLIESDIFASAAPWNRLYRIAGLDLDYWFSFNATMLTFRPDTADTSASDSVSYGAFDS